MQPLLLEEKGKKLKAPDRIQSFNILLFYMPLIIITLLFLLPQINYSKGQTLSGSFSFMYFPKMLDRYKIYFKKKKK